MDNKKNCYQVTYCNTYIVEAENEDEAINKADDLFSKDCMDGTIECDIEEAYNEEF